MPPTTAGLDSPASPTLIGNLVEGEGLVDSTPINAEPQGLIRLPIEIQEKILDQLEHPTLWTTVGYGKPSLLLAIVFKNVVQPAPGVPNTRHIPPGLTTPDDLQIIEARS